MSDTDDTNRAIQALRERATEISSNIVLLTAQRDEVLRAIGIVERNGRKKPGPKAGLKTMELRPVETDAELVTMAKLAKVVADEEREP